MVRLLTVLSLCLGSACGADRLERVPPKAELRVSPTTLDFGRVAAGCTKNQTAQLVNVGDFDLLICRNSHPRQFVRSLLLDLPQERRVSVAFITRN